MPPKNTKVVAAYLSPTNKRELERIKAENYIDNTSHLIERLLGKWVVSRGGTWTKQTPRGKYDRQPDNE
ncbi:MAG TPA: hypothetical protein ENI05_09350 [Porticoccus sp.]|nr:hypothetical protein [Porticoccus sp.]